MTCVCVPGMYPDIPFSRPLSQRRWVAQPCPCPTTLFFSLLLRQSWMTCAQKPFYWRWLCRFLRRLKLFANALFFRPTNRNDGEHAVHCKPTVHTLQLLGCPLLNELASLTSKGINWENSSVHRVLELLYRALPLVQIGPAICEPLFENLHEDPNREIERSNSHDPAGFSMQRSRDVEMLSRVVAAPESTAFHRSC